jgi:hypothetical protein
MQQFVNSRPLAFFVPGKNCFGATEFMPLSNDFAVQMDTSALVGDRSEWDRKVRSDLASELEGKFPGPAFSVLGAQRMLAIKGYRELKRWMEEEIGDKHGEDALRGCARAIRAYIHQRPGLASATWLSPTNKDKEWSDALESVASIIRKALNECGLYGEAAQHAMHWLRGLVRGYVVHEMTGSFVRPVDIDRGFELGISIFLRGLSVLREECGANGLADETAPSLSPAE